MPFLLLERDLTVSVFQYANQTHTDCVESVTHLLVPCVSPAAVTHYLNAKYLYPEEHTAL